VGARQREHLNSLMRVLLDICAATAHECRAVDNFLIALHEVG
jgi:hypothetical protein